jgi:dTDP-4-dehydrorhamnose reductase
MKLLISGSSGLLGRALLKLAAARGHRCVALDRAAVGMSLDATAAGALDERFDGVNHFIHAAANTDVERCELDPAACYRDNVLLTELLAGAARRCGVLMSFVSSTGVYGTHQDTPWAEFDEARPGTRHHRSKLLGEQAVLAANWSNLVVRTGWLFGGDPRASKNFVAKRILEARSAHDGIISSNRQQRGCPTLVDDLAERMLDLIELRAHGVFNAVNTGWASRSEYVREIVRGAGLDVEVRPVVAGDFRRIAPVSDNEMALNWRADELGLAAMRPWQEALSDYLATDDMRALTA